MESSLYHLSRYVKCHEFCKCDRFVKFKFLKNILKVKILNNYGTHAHSSSPHWDKEHSYRGMFEAQNCVGGYQCQNFVYL